MRPSSLGFELGEQHWMEVVSLVWESEEKGESDREIAAAAAAMVGEKIC